MLPKAISGLGMGWKSNLRAPLCSDDKWGTSTRENLGQNLSQCFLVQLQLEHHWPSSSLSSLSFSSSTSSLSWWPWWESPSQTGSQSWSLYRGVALHLEKACVSFFCFLVLDEAQMKQIMMTMRGRVERRFFSPSLIANLLEVLWEIANCNLLLIVNGL